MVLLLLHMSEIKSQRKITLLQASAINMIDMVGIGPFVVMSIVVARMNSPAFLYAWVAGAILSFFDAMIWSELGATFPLAGGSYNFLKESYGEKWGKLMSFLFVWQTMIQAPLVIASAAIGFAQYFSYLIPLNDVTSKIVSGSLVILVVLLLYRKIEAIGKISVMLWVCVILVMLWVIGGGLFHGNFLQPVRDINNGLEFNGAFASVLGFASVKTVYSYLGYYNVCHLGGDIINPKKNIPRSMFVSVAVIASLYLLMNISVASVLPFDTLKNSRFAVSEFTAAIAGSKAANVATALILLVAFSSVFSATLGYSRIPYAAAKDGAFFKVFAKLHPTKEFPYISLIVLGTMAFVFSMFLKMEKTINGILAMRIMIQFIGQSAGLILLSKRIGRKNIGWKMVLYPLPIIITISGWIYIFISTGTDMMKYGLIVIALGIIAWLIKSAVAKEWPFKKSGHKEQQV